MIAALRAALAFYTRFPVGPAPVAAQAAHAAAPLAGVAVALLGTAVDALAGHVGLSPAMAAGLALASMTVATGGLHEDGLADSADGLGGRDRDRRLAILRDSRIGPFGTLALLFSVGLRWSAVAGLPDTRSVLIALVAAQASSRALLPLGLAAVVPARPDGLAASIGRVPVRHVVIATALGLAALAPLGLAAGVALPILAALFAGWRFACLRLFGGQTGDTLGALQQGGDIAVLAIASVHFGGSL